MSQKNGTAGHGKGLAYPSLKVWGFLSLGMGDDSGKLAASVGGVTLLPQVAQVLWMPQEVVEESLYRCADSVSASSDVGDGSGENLLLFHAIWIGSPHLQPLLHHVPAHFVVLLAGVDGGETDVEYVIGRLQAEPADDGISQK